MTRAELLASLVALVEARCVDRVPTRVAVDGPDAAGKTTLARELAFLLEARGRTVIRVCIDDWQRPRAHRYRQGRESPRGYYEDAFDVAAIRSELLEPLGPGGDRRYRTRLFDYRSDSPVDEPRLVAPSNAVLVCDGVFLLRPELRELWDVRVVLTAQADERLRRARSRDAAGMGSAEAVDRLYRARYLPAHDVYDAVARPREHADLVVVNDDPCDPRLAAS